MPIAASLIPELVDVVQNGSHDRRALTLQRIANLFIDGADQFGPDHVALFDDVLSQLVVEIESKARAELAVRLSPIDNAPAGLMRKLALDEDIAVAGPVIAGSKSLAESDLVLIAKSKGQAHLFAIAGRDGIDEAVTDVLVRRGDVEVVRHVAGNASARISETGFSVLVERSGDDGTLAERVGLRPDIPGHLFRDLLVRATAVVRQRLLAAARPETRIEIQRVLDKISQDVAKAAPGRQYAEAERTVAEMQSEGRLNETALADFAQQKKFEETVAAIAALCNVPIEAADRLLAGDRPDPVLILCRAAGYSWATARAIIIARPAVKGQPTASLDAAFANFEKLSPSTAQRVVRFWQVRSPDEAV